MIFDIKTSSQYNCFWVSSSCTWNTLRKQTNNLSSSLQTVELPWRPRSRSCTLTLEAKRVSRSQWPDNLIIQNSSNVNTKIWKPETHQFRFSQQQWRGAVTQYIRVFFWADVSNSPCRSSRLMLTVSSALTLWSVNEQTTYKAWKQACYMFSLWAKTADRDTD